MSPTRFFLQNHRDESFCHRAESELPRQPCQYCITVPLLEQFEISGKTYVYQAKCLAPYHDKRHPLEMGEKEMSEFITYLAAEENELL